MSKARDLPRKASARRLGTKHAGTRPRGDGHEAVTGAAREIFAERGYYGTSIREIAKRAGLSLSALYYWYPGKQDLLTALLEDSDRDYQTRCEEGIEAAGDDPVAKLAALVRVTVEFRVERQVDSRIAVREARNLEPEMAAYFANQARMAHNTWAGVINEGVAQGVFRCAHPDEARRTIFAACNAIAQWYIPTRELTAADLVERYTAIALRAVDAKP